MDRLGFGLGLGFEWLGKDGDSVRLFGCRG